MTDEVKLAICNIALAEVGTLSITDIDEMNDPAPRKKEVILINTYFKRAFEKVLGSFDWSYFVKSVDFTPVDVDEWDSTLSSKPYKYYLPDDFFSILKDTRFYRIPFLLRKHPEHNNYILFTDSNLKQRLYYKTISQFAHISETMKFAIAEELYSHIYRPLTGNVASYRTTSGRVRGQALDDAKREDKRSYALLGLLKESLRV